MTIIALLGSFVCMQKSDTCNHITNFVNYVEKQFNIAIKIIWTDNGMEFAMKNLCQSKEIIHQTTCVETPKQNDIVERKHQHLLNVTRTLLFQATLPSIFWNFAIQHATFLINCILTPLLNNTSAYEKLYDKLYDISVLRVFGCLCYSNTLNANKKKLDSRATTGVFLGFQSTTKRYLYPNLKNHKIDISRHIFFH